MNSKYFLARCYATLNLVAVCCFVVLLNTTAASAAQRDLPTLQNNTDIELEPYLQQWQPPTAVTFEEVLAADRDGKFQPSGSRMIPRIDQDVWYKFQFHTADNYRDTAIINFREFMYEHLDVYAWQGDQWQLFAMGLGQPFTQRPIDYRYFAVPLDTQAGTTSTVYFRAQAFSPAFVVPALQAPRQFFSQALHQSIVSTFIIGIMIGLIFYLWAASRVLLTPGKKITFMGFFLSPLLFILFYDGHLFYHIGTSHLFYQQAFPIITNLWCFFALLFCQQFFALKQRQPLLYKFSNFLLLIITITSLYSLLISPSAVSYIVLNITALVFLILIVVGINAVKNKQNSSRAFLLAMIFFSVIALTRVLISTDTLPYTPHERSIVFGGWLVFTLLMCSAISRQLSATQLRQQQYELKAIETEAREAARNQFLATMSHEIRTPANGVLGMAELLNESRLDSTQSRYVSILLNSAKDLIAIVNDILDLHKVETDRLELETLYFNLDQLLASSLASITQSESKQRYKYELQQIHPLPIFLKGDPTRVQQIVRNLLSSVKKHIERGTITLQVKQVEASSNQTTIETALLINSPQAASPELAAIFNNDDNSSTSIGLTICKRLITLMGGSYGTYAQNNREITIWFRLNFEVDKQRQALLEQKTQKLSQSKLACVFINSRSSDGLRAFFNSHHVDLTALDYDLNLDTFDFSNIDVLLLSNATGEFTRPWLYAADDNNIPIILFNHFNNNIISPSECTDLGVHLINPPYGIGDVVDAVERALSGADDIAVEKQPHKALSELRVLVAEDNPINTKVAQAILERYGIHADFATTGKEAVSAYQQAGHYDLVLMDCEMPEMDGFEATQKIRNFETDQQQQHAVIYALTAYTQNDYKARCKIAGMDGVLVKPLQKALLLDILQSL